MKLPLHYSNLSALYINPTRALAMDSHNAEEQIRALDIEIRRTKNKIKFMEKQLFGKASET
jgi:hypothetical protein